MTSPATEGDATRSSVDRYDAAAIEPHWQARWEELGLHHTDLTATDIEVYEDGKRQTISAFDMFEVAPPPADEAEPTEGPAEAAPPVKRPAPRTRVSTNLDKDDRQGRTFMIVFDDVHLTAGTAARARAATRSALDDLSGVGPARKRALLRVFGSSRALRHASVEEIAAVPGIGPGLAQRIHDHLES